jgi:hypothetical protein
MVLDDADFILFTPFHFILFPSHFAMEAVMPLVALLDVEC